MISWLTRGFFELSFLIDPSKLKTLEFWIQMIWIWDHWWRTVSVLSEMKYSRTLTMSRREYWNSSNLCASLSLSIPRIILSLTLLRQCMDMLETRIISIYLGLFMYASKGHAHSKRHQIMRNYHEIEKSFFSCANSWITKNTE